MFIGLCFVHSELYEDDFIREALETIGDLNNIALDNYCSALIKVRKNVVLASQGVSFSEVQEELIVWRLVTALRRLVTLHLFEMLSSSS